MSSAGRQKINAEPVQPALPLDAMKLWATANAATLSRQRFEPNPQLHLPRVKESMRTMPNHIARTNLFAPISRGKKKQIYRDRVLTGRCDAHIQFSGEQLDEAQADVWMQAMHEANKKPLGHPVAICRSRFLRSIGRHCGKWEYDWLYSAMKSLTFAMIVIEVWKRGVKKYSVGQTRALHLIEGFDYDHESKAYLLRIDPRWHVIYSNKEYSQIDWNKRMQIGQGQDMAKALQRLIATSNQKLQQYDLEWLRQKLNYTSPTHKFRLSIKVAMSELERVGIAKECCIALSTRGIEQAVWTKL